ncbi:MAG TPA: hypothetical protein VFS45_03125 [Sphingomicrobium sp.]|nr:hypothetical protein [Sphingomicrobium sp.]
MLELLFFLLAAAPRDESVILTRDPPQGPMPGENRTLSQPHPNATARTFPDLAVKDMRIDGDTLHVLVANQGKARARGPIRIDARAESNGARAESAPARTGRLAGGESRWVPVRNFALKSAAAGRAMVFALEGSAVVSATVQLAPPMPAAVDRSGQACLPSRGCLVEFDLANNGLRAEGRSIARGRP